MNERVIMNVFVPATGKEAEFLIPVDMTVQDSLLLICEILASTQPDLYQADGQADLVIREQSPWQGAMLNPRDTYRHLMRLGMISPGAKLVLL